MYIISVKRIKDSHTVVVPEWEYFQYDELGSPCFGASLYLASIYITLEEAEKAFEVVKDRISSLNNINEYDLSTLGIREVRAVFKTAKKLTLDNTGAL